MTNSSFELIGVDHADKLAAPIVGYLQRKGREVDRDVFTAAVDLAGQALTSFIVAIGNNGASAEALLAYSDAAGQRMESLIRDAWADHEDAAGRFRRHSTISTAFN